MSETKYVLVIDGANHQMIDKFDEDFNYKYKLGFLVPEKNLKYFNENLGEIIDFLCSLDLSREKNDNEAIVKLLKSAQKEQIYQIIFDYIEAISNLGKECEILIIKSNRLKVKRPDDADEKTQKNIDNFEENQNMISVYHNAIEAIEKKLKQKEVYLNYILCYERLKKYVDDDFKSVAKFKFYKKDDNYFNNFTASIGYLYNLTLEAVNKKNQSKNQVDEITNKIISDWKEKIFKTLFYDRYERVRDAAWQITKSIYNLDENSNDDENDDK